MTTEEASVWVTAAATIATAAATGVLAVVTWLLWKATQRMAAATSEPYVVATLEPNRWSFIHMDLLIENSGTGPAFDVQLAFEPMLTRERRGQKDAVPLNGVAVLRPGQILRDYIGNGADFLPNTYRVSVSWKTSPTASVRVTNSYDLNLKHYDGLIQLGGNDPFVQMAQELKKLREGLEPIFKGSRRMGVDAYSQRDRGLEAEEQERAFERMEAKWGASAAASPPATSPEPDRPSRNGDGASERGA